jgi:hypothetical protein
MKTAWYLVYKNQSRRGKKNPKFNLRAMRDPDVRKQYSETVQAKIQNIENSDRDWRDIKAVIIESAESVIGRVRPNNHHNDYNVEVEKLSEQQRKLRKRISESSDVFKMITMKQDRNKILKEIKRKLKQATEDKIDEVVEEMNRTHDDAKMFSAVRMLKRVRPQNRFVHDEHGKKTSQMNLKCTTPYRITSKNNFTMNQNQI